LLQNIHLGGEVNETFLQQNKIEFELSDHRRQFTTPDCRTSEGLCPVHRARSESSSSCKRSDSRCSCRGLPREETLGSAGTESRVVKIFLPKVRIAKFFSDRWRSPFLTVSGPLLRKQISLKAVQKPTNEKLA